MIPTNNRRGQTVLPKMYGWTDSGERAHHAYLWPCIKALLPAAGSRLSVLDAGCGNGVIAARLQRLGHEVTGLDASPDGISVASKAFPGVRYAVASVYDDLAAMAPKGGWDVIIASEVIEHLYSPQAFLRNMLQCTRSGGFLIVSTPYHGYLKNLALCLLNAWDRHHRVWHEGGHIKFFSQRTLSDLLVQAGFEPPRFRNAGRAPLLWKSMVCRARKPLG